MSTANYESFRLEVDALGDSKIMARQILPSKSDSSQFPSTCSNLPLVFGCSNVAC